MDQNILYIYVLDYRLLIVNFRFIAQQGLSYLRHIAIFLSSSSASCILNVVYVNFLKSRFHIGSIHIGLKHPWES